MLKKESKTELDNEPHMYTALKTIVVDGTV